MTETIGGVTLDTVDSEQHKQFSEIEIVTLPLSDSTNAIAFDFAGVRRTITVKGRLHDTTKKRLMDNYIIPINNLQTGNQTGITYKSEFWANATNSGANPYTDGNITVFVRDFTFQPKGGEIAQTMFTLILEEAS